MRRRNVLGFERAFEWFFGAPGGGVIALPNPVTSAHRTLLADAAIRRRLPTVGAFRFMVESGSLASYGVDVPEIFRRAAEYVDRILKGAAPAELPAQAPTKYELVVNLRTAKAIGLEVPPSLLARADEVIE
jgi:putative tryptophan/tyrosine transport system substrate-binding protein